VYGFEHGFLRVGKYHKYQTMGKNKWGAFKIDALGAIYCEPTRQGLIALAKRPWRVL
jgi:hypothetical protein